MNRRRQLSQRGGGGRYSVCWLIVLATALSCARAVADGPQTQINSWTGEGGDFRLGNAANWSSGTVPSGGNVLIDGITTATTLVNDDGSTFAPASITFGLGNTAVVTIGGGKAIERLAAVTNESSGIHHVFDCAASFVEGAPADILAAAGEDNYIKWNGGMSAYTLAKGDGEKTLHLSGRVSLTGNIGDWGRNVNIHLLALKDEGTLLSIPCSVTTSKANFFIDTGTKVFIDGDLTTTGGRFTYINNGMLEVSGWCVKDMATDTGFSQTSTSTGYIKAYGLKEKTSGAAKDIALTAGDDAAYATHWILGAGGVPAGTSLTTHDASSGNGELITCLYAADDFAIDGSVRLGWATATNSRWPFLHLYTNDYGGTEGKTVTFGGTTPTGNTKHSCLRVFGCGVLHAKASISYPQGVEISDTATLAINPGATIKQRLAVKSGASLVVAASGTVDLSETNVEFKDEAAITMGFNFTDKKTAPLLKLKTNTSVKGKQKIKLSAADGIRPAGRVRHQLTQGCSFAGRESEISLADGTPDWVSGIGVDESGNIYVVAKAQGFAVLVR